MFYYSEGYSMEVGEAAKRLIEARDAYIEAWVKWNETCLSGLMSAEDEVETIRGILDNVNRTQLEEAKQAESVAGNS